MTFNERVKARRLELGLSQKELARRIGVGQSTIGQIENGRNKSSKEILKLAEELQTSAEYLLYGTEPSEPEPDSLPSNKPTAPRINEITDIHRPMLWSSNTPLPEDEYVFTPYLKESECRGGSGSFEIPDYNGFRLPFGKSTLHRKGIMPDNVFCCTLTGDSMEPRIPADAAIAVDTGIDSIKDGKIYAFQHDDSFRVKYLYRLPKGKVRIRSENEETYEDEIVDGEEIRVIGRVFWWSVLD